MTGLEIHFVLSALNFVLLRGTISEPVKQEVNRTVTLPLKCSLH